MKRSTNPTASVQEFKDLSEIPPLLATVQTATPEKKKRKSLSVSRPYVDAWWNDSQFAYTSEQKEVILAALPVNPFGEAIIATIEKFAREYLSECEHSKDEPLPSEITAQIQELETCLENLQRCLWGLHDPTSDAINLPVAEYSLKTAGKFPEDDVDTLREKLNPLLRCLLDQISIAQRTHETKRGTPKKTEGLLFFLNRLTSLWESCGNQLPKRAFDERYPSRLRRFLDTVLLPIPGLDTYTDALKTLLKRKNE